MTTPRKHTSIWTVRVAGSVIATLALSLAACSSAPDNGADGGGTPRTTLVYATGDAEPTCLDPHVGGNFPQALLATQVLESMVALDENGAIVPWLATEWQASDDGLTWDFTLDPEAKFSDGTPVDAEAIKANIEHLQDPETASSTGYLAVQQIDTIEVVSPTQVRFQLTRPDAALLESLAQPWVAIQAPSGMERGTDENCLSPIGSGPFVVTDWVKQDRIELERNTAYTTSPDGVDAPGENAVQKITWRFIPDATARFAALESGEVDIIDNPLPDQIINAENSETLAHLDAPRPGSSNRIELNSGQAPFDDQRVREAFIASTDVTAGIDALFEGNATRSYSALSSVEPLAVQSPEYYTYDGVRTSCSTKPAGTPAMTMASGSRAMRPSPYASRSLARSQRKLNSHSSSRSRPVRARLASMCRLPRLISRAGTPHLAPTSTNLSARPTRRSDPTYCASSSTAMPPFQHRQATSPTTRWFVIPSSTRCSTPSAVRATKRSALKPLSRLRTGSQRTRSSCPSTTSRTTSSTAPT